MWNGLCFVTLTLLQCKLVTGHADLHLFFDEFIGLWFNLLWWSFVRVLWPYWVVWSSNCF